MTPSDVIAIVGVVTAIVALALTVRANAAANRANEIAQRALDAQLDDSKVKLAIEARFAFLVVPGSGGRVPPARPVVTVRNLSGFPVTIASICWAQKEPAHTFWWDRPRIAGPSALLPVRLEARTALMATEQPGKLIDDAMLRRFDLCVVWTECGQRFEAPTEGWAEHFAKPPADDEDPMELI